MNISKNSTETASQPGHINNRQPKKEATLFFRSWFDCIHLQGYPDKECAMAIMALLSYVFYDDAIESFHLPKVLERKLKNIVESMTLKQPDNKSTPAKEKESAQPNHKDGPIYSDDPSVQFLLETIMGKRR